MPSDKPPDTTLLLDEAVVLLEQGTAQPKVMTWWLNSVREFLARYASRSPSTTVGDGPGSLCPTCAGHGSTGVTLDGKRNPCISCNGAGRTAVGKPPPPQGEPPCGIVFHAFSHEFHCARPAGHDGVHSADAQSGVSAPGATCGGRCEGPCPAPVTVPPTGEAVEGPEGPDLCCDPAPVTVPGAREVKVPDDCPCGDGTRPGHPLTSFCNSGGNYKPVYPRVEAAGAREAQKLAQAAMEPIKFASSSEWAKAVGRARDAIEAHTRGLAAEVERLTRENEELRVTSEHWLGKAHSVGAEVSRLTRENEALRKELGNAADDVQFVADWFYRNDRPYRADVLYESAKRIRAISTPPPASPGEGSPGEEDDRGE